MKMKMAINNNNNTAPNKCMPSCRCHAHHFDKIICHNVIIYVPIQKFLGSQTERVPLDVVY